MSTANLFTPGFGNLIGFSPFSPVPSRAQYLGSGAIINFERVLSDAEVKSLALGTDVIQLLAPPGVGKLLVPVGYYIVSQNMTQAWTNARGITVRYTGGGSNLCTAGALSISLVTTGHCRYTAPVQWFGSLGVDDRNKGIEIVNASPPNGPGPNGITVGGTSICFQYALTNSQ